MLYAFLSVIALVSFSARADIDERLKGYIETFQLKPLDVPSNVNKKLQNLGHEFFVTPLLSGNKNISCRDCHHPRSMTMDGLPLGLGEGAEGVQAAGRMRMQKNGHILPRNSQALFNVNGMPVMFWDGRVSLNPVTNVLETPVHLKPEVVVTIKSALAAQAIFPIVDHLEMRGQPGSNEIADAASEQEAWELIVERIMAVPQYKKALEEIYPGETINIGHIGEALAEFQRTAFFYSDTAYDSYIKGDITALSDLQKQGMDVFFGKGKCGECHNGQHLSNFEFHNIGAPQIGPGKTDGDDYGRYEFDKSEGNLYAFRVPPLRNVALTAPYMHNGSIATLPLVVEHYDLIEEMLTGYELMEKWENYIQELMGHDHSKDQIRLANLSPKISKNLFFEPEEEEALIEFLETALTDKRLLPKK